jgi:hypothetical protein
LISEAKDGQKSACDLELCGDRLNASVEIKPVAAGSRDQNPPDPSPIASE